ncbi:MAG: hypothetical protein ACK6DC_00020 [Planctomycetota bacterium]
MLSSTCPHAELAAEHVLYSVKLSVLHPKPYDRDTVVPLGVSVTFPKGIVESCDQLILRSVDGTPLPFQARVLHRWPDGSVRWCRMEWIQTPAREMASETLSVEVHRTGEESASFIDTLGSRISPEVPANQSALTTWDQLWNSLGARVRLIDGENRTWISATTHWSIVEDGPVYQRLRCEFAMFRDSVHDCPLAISCSVQYFPQLRSAVFQLCVRNPHAASHPGGTWDLGNAGSFLIRDLSIEYTLTASSSTPSTSTASRYWVQASPDQKLRTAQRAIQVFQASSGGENWNSRNHVDRSGQVPLPFRGFELRCDDTCERGDRATPRVGIGNGEHHLVLCMQGYWENFPKCITGTDVRLRLGLFPEESGYLHELQGGEQKTHQWAVSFQRAENQEALAWYHLPSQVTPSPESYALAQAVDYLTPRSADSDRKYLALVDSAIEGDDTFLAKREKIDQYGWRNFGDIYGDHEAVYHKGSTPLISHYNNQYDCTAGFAYQWLRTGDFRWYDQMIAMADHAWDIDTYHTEGDKSQYNGGLFWHTYHYADADTATHRSYPRSLLKQEQFESGTDLSALGKTGETLKKVYGKGGGPAASHNYSTGWVLAYFLTGNEQYREAAINAADYVMRIEDGAKTPFRWLCRSDTGHATCSSERYYGPGRASANSTLALLNGYELTGDPQYLQFAIKLMRRTVHPNQDLEQLDLLNAELRWFYTMYLQALARLADTLETRTEFEEDFHYAVDSLLHYASWMVENERPVLDHPERLQYPTETWAAQDIRKWHVLAQASKWCVTSEEYERMMERAEYFYRYSVDSLQGFTTKSLCRPVVILMNFGWQREALLRAPRRHRTPLNKAWPRLATFEPQRRIAIRRAKRCVVAGALTGLILVVSLSLWLAARFFAG